MATPSCVSVIILAGGGLDAAGANGNRTFEAIHNEAQPGQAAPNTRSHVRQYRLQHTRAPPLHHYLLVIVNEGMDTLRERERGACMRVLDRRDRKEIETRS